jgi:AcrR family transcriptional regulator
MNDSTTGLRDRKRLETRARLERAAIDLVLAQGLEHTTIDQISDAADVSARTFFNYFDTKEDALLGLHDTDVSDELIAEHVAAADGARGPELARFAIHLLVSVLGPRLAEAGAGAGAQDDRKLLLERYPQLMSRVFVHMNRTMEALAGAVRELTREQAGATSTETPLWPELVVALCGTAVRVSVKNWAAAGSGSLPDLEERAFALVRETLENLK